jgi:23S rRNA U2552 (ribose-2'-O)-methylase RlmE/FtsJ
MESVLEAKPPWKTIEWIQSPPWQVVPVTYGPWVSTHDVEALRVKEHIGDLDREHKWELSKKLVNPYELVYTHNDERLPPSLILNVQPLSRSYFKMIEILEMFGFFEATPAKLKTAHVAEGPGGFIQAIYQKSEEKRRQITNSYAITLRPTTTHVPGWKKATNFLSKYKQIKIHYGEDGTGDIYSVANQASFIKTCGPGSCQMFTADGGFDFSVDYASQEERVFRLLVCSSLVGLQVLQKDGYFVLKLFDCNSQSTQLLVLILARCFSSWTLYKPAMTRVCNSERYFLGRRMRSVSPAVIDLLHQLREQSEHSMFPMYDMPSLYTEAELAFMHAHIQTTTKQQIQYIELAIHLNNNPAEWWEHYVQKYIQLSTAWCERFRVMSIPLIQYYKLTAARFPSFGAHTSHKGASQQ